MINFKKQTPEEIISLLHLDFYHRRRYWPQGATAYKPVDARTRRIQTEEFYSFLKQVMPKFESDGCSSSPDHEFQSLCHQHDFLYFVLIKFNRNKKFRKQSDLWLFKSLILLGKQLGKPKRFKYYAWSRYLAVRVFGWMHATRLSNKFFLFIFLICTILPLTSCHRSLVIYDSENSAITLTEDYLPFGERKITTESIVVVETSTEITTTKQKNEVVITKNTIGNVFSGIIGFITSYFVKGV